MSDDESLFIESVRTADSLPLTVRRQATTAHACERLVFDESYLNFLREQITLAPRGPEWAATLSRRLAALGPFCGKPTLRGTIATEEGSYIVRVDPETGRVIDFEQS